MRSVLGVVVGLLLAWPSAAHAQPPWLSMSTAQVVAEDELLAMAPRAEVIGCERTNRSRVECLGSWSDWQNDCRRRYAIRQVPLRPHVDRLLVRIISTRCEPRLRRLG